MLCGETRLQADQAFVADRQLALEGTAQAHVQVVQALCLLAQAFAGMAQAAGDAFQAQAFAQQLVAHAQHQAPAQAVETLLQVAGVGRQQFGGGRRRRRAHVGDEVADRYVGLVSDRADDRRGAGRHGARHRFFVEAPEVFQEPPPRARISASKPCRSASCSARTICATASRPWTAVGTRVSSTCGARRRNTLMMSRITAPLGELTIPMRRGWAGSGRLRSLANRPSPASFSFNASKARRRAPSPAGSTVSAINW